MGMPVSADWEGYYTAIEGRAARPLLSETLALMSASKPDGLGRVAIDLGCGDGTETRELLARGWRVVAIDKTPAAIARVRASVPAEDRARLTAIAAVFTEVELPPADLIYAGLSLPFCDPASFGELWPRISVAVREDGWFAGHFFGPRDSWAGRADMTFLSRAEVCALLTDFRIEAYQEQDEDGDSFAGRKHWHVFHVIARKVRSPRGATDRG
jgi:SAM-dependent methyltransferase